MDGSKTTAHEARPAATGFNPKAEREKGRAEHAPAPGAACGFLTTVITEFKSKDRHHRILFGEPVRRSVLIRVKGHLKVRHEFAQDARFVLDLWRRNEYGTLQWRCFVCESVAPGDSAQGVPQVIPGARVLLVTKGAAESRIFLSWAYAVSRSGVDLLRIPRETFEAAHFRLKGSRAQGLHVNTLSGVF